VANTSGDTKVPQPGERERPAHEHAELPPLSDPGKDERAAVGVPVVPAFDGYRAFAILAIVVFHVITNAGVTQRAGGNFIGQMIWATGPQFVDILFIVSGFVVFLPTVAQRGRFGSIGGYAIRRGARLLPAYWLALGVMILVMTTQPGLALPNFGDLASNFSGMQTTVQMIAPGTPIGFGLDTPLWTLTLEISFYVVLPFIAGAYYRHPFVGLAIALVIAVAWREGFSHIGEVAQWFGGDLSLNRALELQFNSVNQLPNWAFSFAAGMTGAWTYVHVREQYDEDVVRRWAIRALVPASLVFALFVYLAGRKAIGTTFGEGLVPSFRMRQSAFLSIGYTASLAAVMLSLALAPYRLQRPFANPLARKLGDISYGIYLVQEPILWFILFHFTFWTGGGPRSAAVWLLAVIPVAVLYGYLSARFVEQPIRRWARRFGRHDQAVQRPSGLRAKAQT
jgi:peptidoglycan/LPS O-acetylase OafA/YrhL